MRIKLIYEQSKEFHNAAALGLFNASVVAEDGKTSEELTLSKEAQKIVDKINKIDEKLDKIGFDTALNYGWGTQRLGHAQKKADGLASERNRLRDQLYDFGYEMSGKKITKI